ncbi:FadR/GntR family transcriptional regulator [Glaciimonas immobilis]|uniref:GntR family transcriptional repressor for pyruvate dehydrogenase complex n=1 Tax=Glaciimonas immobilis TaxID=728004 RepID=A0A840RWT9_9BURK|nr:FadR/GntR family transcriptional regulator [Glaciimonas immobilis]KAF3996604.1 FadR family transcriptional regulator [Glaciimonas immobilis]MBB5201021.1 GntR family transcriptional repressor for pyruvate dehydrogenase complex [Glaciimonas immobilis]
MNFPATPSAPPKKHRNLAQGVVAYIADGIREGHISPGDKLPTESEIMRIRGVSRTVVREAISHLQASGMVETRHGIGTFALAPAPAAHLGIDPNTIITMRDVLAILELRISLETESAGLAASRRTEGQLQQLRSALDKFQISSMGDGETVTADLQFHLTIALASGNRYFHDILTHLGTNIIPRARLNSAKLAQDDPAIYMERVNREHEDIFNAIARQDPESARAAMRTHLSNSRERLRRAQELIEAS